MGFVFTHNMKNALLAFLIAFVLSGCVAWNRGLEPTNPKYSPTSWTENVNSLTPRLEWMPYTNISDKQDFRYQLQILDGNVVRLFKDNIHEPQYIVEEALLPNREYQWQVRPAWTVNGKVEGGNWNDKKYFYISPVLFGWGSKTYKIRTPDIATSGALQPSASSPASKISSTSPDASDTRESIVKQAKVTAVAPDNSERLKQLQRLKNSGVITEADYNAKKKEILNSM